MGRDESPQVPHPRRIDPVVGVCILISVAAGLAYWALAAWRRENEPFSMAVMHRFGDLQFLPSIANFGIGNFGENGAFELWGTGFTSHQFLQFAFYGSFWALLGARGLVVADALVALGFHFAVVALATSYGVRRRLAHVAAALVVGGGYETLLVGLHRIVDPRWGRPHLTVPVLFVLLAVITRVLRRGDDVKPRGWLASAVLLALLIQFGDPFTGMGVAFGMGVVVLWRLMRRPERGARILALALGAVAFGLALAPFIGQRLVEHHDVVVRSGVFEVERLDPLFALPRRRILRIWALALVALVAVAVAAGRSESADRRAHAMPLGALAVVVGLSMFAMPLSCIVLGKSVQPYHFPYSMELFGTVGLLVFSFELVDRLQRGERGSSRILLYLGCALALATWVPKGLLPRKTLVARGLSHVEGEGHVRTDRYPEFEAGYREAFRELVQELSSDRYPERGVLATFDHQVAAWWQAFRGGCLFVPDNFITTVTDEELERRFVHLSQILDMDDELYAAFASDETTQMFWLGFDKRQYSTAYAFGDLDDYTPEQAAAKGGIFDNWHVVMPRSELARLRGLRRETPAWDGGDPRLDFVVLTGRELERGLTPSAEFFDSELVFENRIFRVYTR